MTPPVASSQATLMTLQVLLPGLFAAIVVWVAARMAVAGSLTPGGLITFYGYTAYLSWPLWVFTKERENLGVMMLELFVFCHRGGAYGYSSVALGST